MINYTVEMITLIEYVKQFFKNSPVIDVTSATPPRHTQIWKYTRQNDIEKCDY